MLEIHPCNELNDCSTFTACYADIAFVIDNSGSIRENSLPGVDNWRLILEFVKSIIEFFTIGQDATRIAVIDFGWCFKC